MPIAKPLHLVPLDSIQVSNRYRRHEVAKATPIEELAESICAYGLLSPIIIDREKNLVAGERRLTAYKLLRDTYAGEEPNPWNSIPYRYYDLPLDADEARVEKLALELHENIKRADFHWKDRARLIHDIHVEHATRDPEWSQEKTASYLGENSATVYRSIHATRAIDAGDEKVISAESLGEAWGYINREAQRSRQDMLNAVAEGKLTLGEALGLVPKKPDVGVSVNTISGPALATPIGESATAPTIPVATSAAPTAENPANPTISPIPSTPSPTPSPIIAAGPILQADFNQFAASYSGPKFNFIHCDFPYGVNLDRSRQLAAKDHESYADSPEIFWQLCTSLRDNIDKLLLPNSHVMFWFSMDYYAELVEFFSPHFRVDPFPLYWMKSCNRGIAPDPRRRARRVVETALMMTRGDRFIVDMVANGCFAPSNRESHISQKPVEMLEHFFRMFISPTTRMLDPTAGSGTSLRVASAYGAEFVQGLELNPEFAAEANRQWLAAKRDGFKLKGTQNAES